MSLVKSHSQSSSLLFDSAKDIKHKISFLLQKPEPQTAEPKPKEKSAIAAAPAAAAAATAKRSADCFALWFDLKHVDSSHLGVGNEPVNVSLVKNAIRNLSARQDTNREKQTDFYSF